MTYLIDVLESIDKRLEKRSNNPDIIEHLKEEREYFQKEQIKEEILEELKEDETPDNSSSYKGNFTRTIHGWGYELE